jgi:hypothetical protein
MCPFKCSALGLFVSAMQQLIFEIELSSGSNPYVMYLFFDVAILIRIRCIDYVNPNQ